MAQNSLGKKGQYFSFDAIIATVIVVIAMTSLLTYWFSVQSVVDAKSNYMQSAAMNMADTLMSPGIPENWYDHIDTLHSGSLRNFHNCQPRRQLCMCLQPAIQAQRLS